MDKSEWHNIVFFGKLAEIAGEYLSKRSTVCVGESLTTDKMGDRNRTKGLVTKITWSKLIILGERKKKECHDDFDSSPGGGYPDDDVLF